MDKRIDDKPEIAEGQIWTVIKKGLIGEIRRQCICLGCGDVHYAKRMEAIPPNMRIEIRFRYAWHYRTECDEYFHSEPENILDNCILLGTINSKTRFENKKSLKEIIEQKLYTHPGNSGKAKTCNC